ncbi:MAG: hypothetical protein ACRCUS_08300 [Anaerovoracaceae bacterium]
MKTWYQFNKNSFSLPRSIYRKTVYTIKAYPIYQAIANSLENSSLIGEEVAKLACDVVTAQSYVEAIDKALSATVHEEFQPMVLDAVIKDRNLMTLAEQYYLTEGMIKRWKQVFIYTVADNLGDNYFKD